MNTKEAIEFIKEMKDIDITCTPNEYGEHLKLIDEIIELLQRGEKYEAIVNELENDYGFLAHRYAGSDSTDYLRYIIPRLKQKYFPKPSDNFTEKVMEKINDEGEVRSNVDSKTNI